MQQELRYEGILRNADLAFELTDQSLIGTPVGMHKAYQS